MTHNQIPSQPWPSEIRLNAQKDTLRVTFLGGAVADLPAEFLRVMSPSAEVQGHSPSQRKLVAGKRSVLIKQIEPVGNYAVRLVFNDGHNTGIYSWAYFHDLVENFDELWKGYLEELTMAGLTRGA